MKPFLGFMTCLTAIIAGLGVITYAANFGQNAFTMCELVVCLYCAVSILIKFSIYNGNGNHPNR